MNYHKQYYNKNKEKWNTKYNKTPYNDTKNKRKRKYMWVMEHGDTTLKFRSLTDVQKYFRSAVKRENFDFERDFADLIQV